MSRKYDVSGGEREGGRILLFFNPVYNSCIIFMRIFPLRSFWLLGIIFMVRFVGFLRAPLVKIRNYYVEFRSSLFHELSSFFNVGKKRERERESGEFSSFAFSWKQSKTTVRIVFQLINRR